METEEYDGSSWTAVNDCNVSNEMGGDGGTQASTVYGGGDSDTDASESYNRTTWSPESNINSGGSQRAGSGTGSLAVIHNGSTPAADTATEEWAVAAGTATVTTS